MRFPLLSTALALCLPASALAQSTDATDLDQLLVTATRTAVTVDASLAAVEVIDRDEIDRSQAHSLPQLLRGRAGINLVNQGGLGKVTTLFLRGTESDHTLFLVDGVRIGSSTSGLASLQDIPIEMIDRIEIVRGPRSSLYGSEAIGGVIQIFTRRSGSGVHPRLRVGTGSHGLREASAGVDGRSARGWFGIDAGWQQSDGINACRGIGYPFYAGCGMDSPDPDRDGYRRHSLSLRGGVNAGDTLTLEANALRNEGHNAYDSDPAWGLPDNSDTVQQVVGGKLRYVPSERVTVQLVAGRNIDASDNFLQDTWTDRFDSRRDSATLQADVDLRHGQLLTLGIDWLRDHGSVTGPFASFGAARGNRAGFVQYQGRFGRHNLEASLRQDDNDQFGRHATGGVAWGIDIARGLRVTANAGTAFKAPTFNELYYPYYGNPDLRPETSRSVELGVGRRLGSSHWQLNAYQTTINDLITYDIAIHAANNLDSARIRGAELTAGTTLAGWDLSGQATVSDPRNLSAANAGKLLPRRARRSARVDADRGLGRWRIGMSWIAEGGRFDDVANQLPVGGYATLDLRAEHALRPAWTLLAELRNAFDRRYETAAYYNQPGREFALSLRWRPAD
ncbi:TonB-dependent vitamin B12 receptor [Cognatiluteimonas profundi]|uniref:TonB-dependent vitamin B12 receptor n=1 Tax=Cognatiluteimonas profundi TaxID=2594501 RepID=UPI00131ADA4E|nr:TonB-dependent vitamin B12 receptor [Lysobacter profundi]